MKKELLFRFLTVAAISLSINLTGIAQDWPQWRGVNRDGKITGFKAPAEWPQQLKQDWKVSVGFADATPALVNNRLYVFTRIGENEVLQCLDATSGKQIWQADGYPATAPTGPAASHPGPRSSPTVAEGKVITVGVAGDIACFDAATGKLVWRNEEFKGAVPQFFTSMSPIVVGGTCLAHLGGPQSGQFVAFDLKTGAIKWKVAGEGPAYGSPVLMTIDGTQQVVFPSLTKLVSLNIPDGALLWEFATPAGQGRVTNSTTPVIDKQKIYFTGLNNGFNAAEVKKQGNTYTVSTLWTNPDFSTQFSTPVLKDGFLYGLSSKSRLFCINATTGQTAWTDDAAHQNFGSIIDIGPLLIALSSTSNMVIYKPDGKAYSQVAIIKVSDNAVYAHPILSGNHIFIKDNESLTAFTTK